MESYIPLLQKSPMFFDISEEDIRKICDCLSARERTIEKNSAVFRAGDEVNLIYLLLSGSLHITDEDFWGNRSIIEMMEKYTLFGEAYAFSSEEQHLVNVIAAEKSTILEMNPTHLFEPCPDICQCHGVLVKNIACILSRKVVRLTRKLGYVTQRSIREKILSYLSQCARQAHSSAFYIPYSRQQLADYLCVDRTSLSHELSRLHKLGIIKYRKNYFELITSA